MLTVTHGPSIWSPGATMEPLLFGKGSPSSSCYRVDPENELDISAMRSLGRLRPRAQECAGEEHAAQTGEHTWEGERRDTWSSDKRGSLLKVGCRALMCWMQETGGLAALRVRGGVCVCVCVVVGMGAKWSWENLGGRIWQSEARYPITLRILWAYFSRLNQNKFIFWEYPSLDQRGVVGGVERESLFIRVSCSVVSNSLLPPGL